MLSIVLEGWRIGGLAVGGVGWWPLADAAHIVVTSVGFTSGVNYCVVTTFVLGDQRAYDTDFG